MDRIGAGQRVEIFESGNFMCPIKAFKKYKASLKYETNRNNPVFREEDGKCFTGKELNLCLDYISFELKIRGLNVKTHSYRAGVATMMASLGYSDEEIMASGK